ncbi:MAG: acyl-CoA dehydrogenase domain-containing protein [Steroidobacteraceae bacterium]
MRLAWGIYRTVEPGNALDLPGQIEQALAAGLINAAEAAQLREFDRKVMAIIDVDDFTHEELQAAVQAEPKPAGVTRLNVA